MSRTKKTIKNTLVGLICTGISYILSFILQALFIRLLGLEYSGINTLFSDILKILNLAEMGFNNAILFKLYQTIAKGDNDATEMYLTAYKKICYLVGTVVGLVGLCFVPFLDYFVKEQPTFSEPLWAIYIIVLGTGVANHFINYKNILLIAKQDRYISTLIEYGCIFSKHALQIIVLVFFKNIYLYLLVALVMTIIQGISVGIISKRRYKLSWSSKKHLAKAERIDISKDVGALAIFKFCRTLNVTIDTLLISKVVAVSQTAIYGSTTIITSGLNTFIETLNDGMIASIGDLNASGDKDNVERVLQSSVHCMYLLYGTCAAVLVPFLRCFMNWWIGYSLSDICIYVLIFNFYTGGINANISTYRNAMGLYRKGWKRPMATVIVNSVVSFILIQRIGILGAFLGTTIANVTTMLWYDPMVVYRYGLKRSSKGFFIRYIFYGVSVSITALILHAIGQLLPEAITFVSLIWHGVIYSTVAMVCLLSLGAFIPTQKEVIMRIMKRG